MLKNQKGITLVALVVTIIVLLILAAVTITLALGQNGIIGKAVEAKESQVGRSVEEDCLSALAALQVDIYANDLAFADITDDKINAELNAGTVSASSVNTDAKTITATYTANSDNKTYSVTLDFTHGKVTATQQ